MLRMLTLSFASPSQALPWSIAVPLPGLARKHPLGNSRSVGWQRFLLFPTPGFLLSVSLGTYPCIGRPSAAGLLSGRFFSCLQLMDYGLCVAFCSSRSFPLRDSKYHVHILSSVTHCRISTNTAAMPLSHKSQMDRLFFYGSRLYLLRTPCLSSICCAAAAAGVETPATMALIDAAHCS
ncbi:uncharacterized protein VDAG_08354 [Verticillium dahliae VdLs.17]|uniref:Secreted protein n=1 Tax=Verticillium dahliae (strain VdLs.17 / ATCC MYA-4575 / FGSC 10137) TaxID=498257 RepID=G2XDX2_VERDV